MILRNTSAQISVTLSVDDAETDPSPDSATVQITREDGTVLVAETAATEGGTGRFTFQLTPTHTADLDVLTATWQMTVGGMEQTLTTFHEIVGGFICSLEAISAAMVAGGGAAPDAATLRTLRANAERKLEDACNVAFRPRYAREKLDGDGTDELFLAHPRTLAPITATVSGAALSGGELAEVEPTRAGFYREAGWAGGRRNIEIAYEHGWPSPPEPITRAAIKLAAVYFEAGGDDRISRFREDDQEFFLSVAGANRDTGIPDVDRAIQDYRYPVLGR